MCRNVRGDKPRLRGDDAEGTSPSSSPSEDENDPSSSSEKTPLGSSRSAASASADALVRAAPVPAKTGDRASDRV